MEGCVKIVRTHYGTMDKLTLTPLPKNVIKKIAILLVGAIMVMNHDV